MVDVIVNFAYTLQTFCSLDLKAIGRVEPKLVPDGEAACGDLSSINVRRPNRLMDVLFLRGKAAEGEEINFHFELCFIPGAQVRRGWEKKIRNLQCKQPDWPFTCVYYLLGFPFDMQ